MPAGGRDDRRSLCKEGSKESWGGRSKGPGLAASLSRKAPVPMAVCTGPIVLGRLHPECSVGTTTRDQAEGDGWLEGSQAL